MGISLNKKTGINLKKGSSISLEKQGKLLEEVCIGLNWGAIQKKALFGLVKTAHSVDLDGSVSMFDKDKNELDTVYYSKLQSKDGAINHSGDDVRGDAGGDDGIDNEIIEINLGKVTPEVEQIVFYLNSYNGQDFANIPYSKIRIFEGSRHKVDDVFATFNLSADASFAGNVSMILGKLIRTRNNWKFEAIGDAIPTKKIQDTIPYIKENYL
ncbi:TerD family protein [Microscilla marina]|uniref:Tellurium resistance protein n=1 Tax=Microscilla marina ATCC 23134 TaxID=313606 RepID=A1ZIU7_MICM2|nr:TerD family protein [Microscilla marina]EAY29483.1 tellurium resistance protein [Microscilla marina ATCC 23134]